MEPPHRMRHLSLLLLLAAIGHAPIAAGAEIDFAPGVAIDPQSGTIGVAGDIRVVFALAGPKWTSNTYQSAHSMSRATCVRERPGELLVKGWFRTGAGALDLTERITKGDDGQLAFHWRVTNAAGIDAERVYALLKFPAERYAGKAILIDGDDVALPEPRPTTNNYRRLKHVTSISIPTQDAIVTLSGDLNGLLMSSPRGPGCYYGLRLYATPTKGKITDSSLGFTLAMRAFAAEPISIASAATTSFTDDVDGDGKGGWTDQGAEKDLRAFKPGTATFNGITFKTLRPQDNGGKTCIVLRGSPRPYLPGQATVPLAGRTYRRLHLLHAAAWGKGALGEIRVDYQDGTVGRLPLTTERDAPNWVKAGSGANHSLAWSGSSPAFGSVHLFTSSFPLDSKPVASLTFDSSDTVPLWMIAAVSGSTDALAPVVKTISDRTEFRADARWAAIDYHAMRFEPGSALDFSPFLDAPAGKHGPVVCRGDTFRFADRPDEPARFYGVVLSHAQPFHEKRDAERLADQLAFSGYNAVRFHIYVNWLVAERGSPELDPEGFDKFSYLLHCFAKRGIYYTLALGAWGHLEDKVVHDVPEFAGKKIRFEFNGLLPISADAMAYFRRYSRNVLCTTNPYTGLAMKDDPALISIELTNENGLFAMIDHHPLLKVAFERTCAEALRRERGAAPSAAEVGERLPEYLVSLQKKIIRDMRVYFAELGVKRPITDLTFRSPLGLILSRVDLDYVDVHGYWDLRHWLKSKAKERPYRQTFRNPNTHRWHSQTQCAAARIFGMPFVTGEYNMTYPQPYWAFMGPSLGYLAGLQGWSGMFRCGYPAFPVKVLEPNRVWNIDSAHPQVSFSERMGAMLFSQNEIRPAPVTIPYVVTADYIHEKLDIGGGARYPRTYHGLGLRYRIGTVVATPETDLSGYPCIVVPKDMKLPGHLEAVPHVRDDESLGKGLEQMLPPVADRATGSPSRQADLDAAKGSFSIVTKRCECLMLPASLDSLAGDVFRVSANRTVATCFVGSLDGKTLRESRRMLLLYVTDQKNTGTVIEREEGSVVTRRYGRLPLLALRGQVDCRFRLPGRTLPQVWALRYDGSRATQLPARKTDDGFALTAQAVTSKDAYFAYELVW